MAETKLYLNIQEQVEKNKNDIKFMLEEEGTLNKFGIKVIGQEDDVSDMPSVADYKEEHEDWAYGDAYAIGTEAPYTLYILTRANGTHPNDYWFNIGQFPVPGPQGETGEQGPAGHTPQVTVNPTIPVTMLPAGSSASGSVRNLGTNDDPQLAFSFDIPKGDKGDTGEPGRPGAFHINGQVANASLLPDASLVDPTAAYAVGTVLPYDIYVIMTVGGVQSWLNLGPIINEISDTYSISDTWHSSGTLSEEQLDALVNDANMNFLKIGNYFFVKNIFVKTPGFMLYSSFYPISINATGKANVIYLTIDASTGAYETDIKELVDISSAQTIPGEKTFEKPVIAPNTFNVINASDIVNNTLTQAQYDLITNGRPTRIDGNVYSTKYNAVLQPGMLNAGETLFRGEFIVIDEYAQSYHGIYSINTSTKEINYIENLIIAPNGTKISLNSINGKSIPAYPSSTGTFVLKCVDGTLTWVAE